MRRELALVCQACGRRVLDDDGYLWAHTGEVNTVQQAARAWEEKHTEPDGSMLVGFKTLLAYPEPACWQTHHEQCDPVPGESHYRIPADKLRTRADLLDWTAHVMEKDWLRRTDWRDVLREARNGGKRLSVTDR